MKGPTVAFLRAINVGRRRVKMDALREAVASYGLTDVSTFIASGNVIFDADDDPEALGPGLEAHLERALGFRSEVFLRSIPELEALASASWLQDREARGFAPHVLFMHARPPLPPDAFVALESPDDRFHSTEREVVWFRRGRLGDSGIAPGALDRAMAGKPNTMRSIHTVRRILSKFG